MASRSMRGRLVSKSETSRERETRNKFDKCVCCWKCIKYTSKRLHGSDKKKVCVHINLTKLISEAILKIRSRHGSSIKKD